MKGKTILLIILAGVFVAIVRTVPYGKSKIFSMISFEIPENFEFFWFGVWIFKPIHGEL
jgi:hypothetical protein